MLKEFVCNPVQIPIGSLLKDNLYNEKNILLLNAGTRITDKVHETLLRYGKPVKILIDVIEDNSIKTRASDETFSLSKEIKERTKQGVEYIYNNPNSSDLLIAADEVSTTLLDVVDNSTDINISLNNIKVSDEYTFKHCVDVATMGVLIGKNLLFSDRRLKDIVIAGILHDLGKTKVPDEILNKPGRLTDDEFKIIQTHPIYGYDLVSKSNQLSNDAKLAILEHHEKIDGTGYPRKCKGDEISLLGRLLSIVDVYDALVTKRPYRDEIIEPATAIEMMLSMSNQFDIQLLRAFLNCVVIYPIGTKLQLSDNKFYTVVEQNEGYPTRPTVEDILTGERFNLCKDPKCLSLVIVRSC